MRRVRLKDVVIILSSKSVFWILNFNLKLKLKLVVVNKLNVN